MTDQNDDKFEEMRNLVRQAFKAAVQATYYVHRIHHPFAQQAKSETLAMLNGSIRAQCLNLLTLAKPDHESDPDVEYMLAGEPIEDVSLDERVLEKFVTSDFLAEQSPSNLEYIQNNLKGLATSLQKYKDDVISIRETFGEETEPDPELIQEPYENIYNGSRLLVQTLWPYKNVPFLH